MKTDIRRAAITVGVVGCGDISAEYIRRLAQEPEVVQIVRCADLDPVRAAGAATAAGCVPCEVPELLADPEVDIVLNLTPPRAHAEVSRQALLGGKHVYSEKPLATNLADARLLIRTAEQVGRVITTAPDTFLAAKIRVAVDALSRGDIGPVVAIHASATYSPPELWHPDPRFLYRPGAGPLYDMAPYFMHVLLTLVGPITNVYARGRTAVPNRVISSGSLAGTSFEAETPTHVSAILTASSGVTITLNITFDAVQSPPPFIEIQGTTGAIVLDDPENFDGAATFLDSHGGRTVVPAVTEPALYGRGAGLLDLARALTEGRPPLVSPALGLHTVAVLEAITDSIDSGQPADVPALEVGLDVAPHADPSSV